MKLSPLIRFGRRGAGRAVLAVLAMIASPQLSRAQTDMQKALMGLSLARLIQAQNAKNAQVQAQAQAQAQAKAQQKNLPVVVTFNSVPASQFAPAQIQDISGVWEGEQSNGSLLMYYQVCITQLSGNVYTGYDYCLWERNINNAPINTNGKGMPNARKSFIGAFKNGELDLQEVQRIGNTNWGLGEERLKFVDDRGTPVIINNKPNEPGRKMYLRRTGTQFPEQYRNDIITATSLQVVNPVYLNSSNEAVFKYHDHGLLSLTVTNSSSVDFPNLQGSLTTAEPQNGILDYNKLSGTFSVSKNGKLDLKVPLRTDFAVPAGDLHLNVVFSYKSIPLARATLDVPTESFYRTADVVLPDYTSPRMRAVSGYFGFSNTAYTDVSPTLDPLAESGDRMASMWRAVFESTGQGGYKMDEARGYASGRQDIRFVEERARQGDAEALYLMFYACQLGLEGDSALTFGDSFLEKSASAGFLPAEYDFALDHDFSKDYRAGLLSLQKVYDLGVRKSAKVIGFMYERGFGIDKDIDTAITWYKKGMDFGDPEASLAMANLYSSGFEDTPPDIHKALALGEGAARQNCAAAMIFNGMVYFDGKQGIARDIPAALKWFRSGSDLGDRQAMLALGETYMADAPGFVKDEHSGLFWIKRAAELGSPKAMMILSKYYNTGSVGDKNIIAGRYWYNQAALAGFAQPDATGLLAGRQSFLDFWKYADFSPSYIYVDEYGNYAGEGDDGLFNGLFTGLFGAMSSYYGNQQQLIDGLEYICKKSGKKVYGGTVSSSFISNLYLKEGETVEIRSYGIISTGMMSGPANADGLGGNWPEYRVVPTIPCSAVMAKVMGGNWQFVGQRASFTASQDGQIAFALNAIDYRNYKGYFDIVLEVPDSSTSASM